MQADHDWNAHCEHSQNIVNAVRSRAQLGITIEQMKHLHNDAFVTFWYTADEAVQVSYRLAYPELFAPATFDIPSWLQ